MTIRVFFLLLATGFFTGGCTTMKVLPMIPDAISAQFRANPIALGMVYDSIEEGKFDQAEASLKKLESEPPRPLLTSEIAYIRALMAERQGQTEEALAKYRAIVAEHPQTPDAYLAKKKLEQLASPTPAAGQAL